MSYLLKDGSIIDKFGFDWKVSKGKSKVSEIDRELTEEERDQLIADRQSAQTFGLSEDEWAQGELYKITNEIDLHQDNDARKVATETEWRDYRKELRDYLETETLRTAKQRPIKPTKEV